MKAVWLVLLLSLLLTLFAAGTASLRLRDEWLRRQSWQEHEKMRAEREAKRQEALNWWRENIERYRTVRRSDEHHGTSRQVLWQMLETRALEHRWEDLRLEVVPAPPREPDLSGWRRQRYQLFAELPHDGGAQWLWQTLNKRYGARVDWRRCRLERTRTRITPGASHLSWQCRIDLWQWHPGEDET